MSTALNDEALATVGASSTLYRPGRWGQDELIVRAAMSGQRRLPLPAPALDPPDWGFPTSRTSLEHAKATHRPTLQDPSS